MALDVGAVDPIAWQPLRVLARGSVPGELGILLLVGRRLSTQLENSKSGVRGDKPIPTVGAPSAIECNPDTTRALIDGGLAIIKK